MEGNRVIDNECEPKSITRSDIEDNPSLSITETIQWLKSNNYSFKCFHIKDNVYAWGWILDNIDWKYSFKRDDDGN